MKKYFALLLLAVTLVGIHGGTAQAVAPTKVITVSPATAKPYIKPGQTIRDKFQVINQGDNSYDVTIYAAPFGVKGEQYTPDFSPIPNKPAVNSWISFDKTAATVAKDKKLTVNYSVTVPKGTEPGGYYAVAFVQSKSEQRDRGVLVNQRVGEVFYIQVAGDVRQDGKIKSWEVPFMQAAPLKADLRLSNDGGVHYASNTRIHVKDIFGNTKHNQTSDKQILPGTIRHIPFVWEDAPPFGLFKVTGMTHLPTGDVQLETKLVLMMSPLFRAIFGGMLAIIVIGGVALVLAKRRRATSLAEARAAKSTHHAKNTKHSSKKKV